MLGKLLKFYREKGKIIIFITFLLNLVTGITCLIVSYFTNSPELVIACIFNLLMSVQVLSSYVLVLRLKALRKILRLVSDRDQMTLTEEK